MIEAGKTVALEYTLSLEDGSVVQTNAGGEPLEYVHGEQQILPALEQELSGLGVDEEKTVELSASDAYGEVDPNAFQEVDIDKIPEGARRVGAELRAEGFNGTIRVHDVKDSQVVLDFNHPLAGEDLTFKIKVLAVE